ncbi:hypothetical protein, partial [Pseudomonas viridiflava]|uniref:hypothetical protein n=1 Tax=Pseudomonas viridiflava TaxID=33069 RepID=UPI00197CBE49
PVEYPVSANKRHCIRKWWDTSSQTSRSRARIHHAICHLGLDSSHDFHQAFTTFASDLRQQMIIQPK